MKFDEILVHIGEFGPYQKRVYFLLCLPALLCGAQVMSIVFTMATPMHRCKIPNYPNDTYNIQGDHHAVLVNLTIPTMDQESENPYSECHIYSDDNATQIRRPDNPNDEWLNITWAAPERDLQPCSSWVYDQSEYLDTAVAEFNIVCEDKIYKSHGNMVGFAGALFGCISMGIIADVIGRKNGIMLSLLIQFVTSLAVFLAPSYQFMVAFRGVAGIASYSLFAISASMGIELVGPSKRTFTGVVVEFYWAVGVLLTLPIAYFIREWRYIQLTLCLLTVPLFSLWWLIPESPRWLLDKKRFAETEKILEKICHSNNTKLPAGAIDDDTADEGPQAKIWCMFTNRVLLLRTLIIFFNWFAVNLLYYGLSLNLENLAGSTYLNYLYGGLAEILAYTLCLFLLDRTGRRKLHCLCMLIGGISCLAVILPMVLDTKAEHQWLTTILAMVGKLCASGCYAIIYIMAAELFPTVVRNMAVGCCSILETVGGMSAPYIADMGMLIGGPFASGLPMLVFGGVSIIAGCMSLILPETLNRTLPETLQDAIDFTKKQPSARKGRILPSDILDQEVRIPMTLSSSS
ncbi:hypothetical protein BsWGS_28273 [Bradybaena similaris]